MKQNIKNDMYNKVYSIDQLSNNSPIFKEYLQEMKKDRGNTLETIDEDDINNNQNFQHFFVELTQKDFFPKNKINREENKKLPFNKIKIKKNILRSRKSRNLNINNISPLNPLKKVKTTAFINKNNIFQTQNSNENSIRDKKKITVSVDSFNYYTCDICNKRFDTIEGILHDKECNITICPKCFIDSCDVPEVLED